MLDQLRELKLTGRKSTDHSDARKGYHLCYISNLAKLKSHYPGERDARPRFHPSLNLAAEREHAKESERNPLPR